MAISKKDSVSDWKKSAPEPGLYLVATPIGNLEDLSFRAQRILAQCETILCEDTRVSAKLLHHYGINTARKSFHKFNEMRTVNEIIARLEGGAAIALISDAGTPTIADPGSRLVHAVLKKKLRVHTLPGCCAVSAAASASGLAEEGFVFIGFLPAKRPSRRKALANAQHCELAIICFESPQRIVDTLEDIVHVFGEDRNICIARELTKRFETIHLDCAAAQQKWVTQHNQQKGELVIVIEAGSRPPKDGLDTVINILLDAKTGARQSSQIASAITGVSKKVAYQRYLYMQAKAR